MWYGLYLQGISLFQAVCCEDGKHCCAAGYRCNKKSRGCIKTGIERLVLQQVTNASLSHLNSTPFCPVEDGLAIVEDRPLGRVCPRGWVQCMKKHTCCKLKRGGFGCCPMQNVSLVGCSEC